MRIDIITESALEHVCSFCVNINSVNLDFRFLRDPVQSSLSFFFLYLQGDPFDWTLLNSLYEMGSEAGNLISELFSWDFCNFRQDPLVSMEIRCQLGIVPLKQNFCGSFYCFCSNSSHDWSIIFRLFYQILIKISSLFLKYGIFFIVSKKILNTRAHMINIPDDLQQFNEGSQIDENPINRATVCQFICIKSGDPPIHVQKANSLSKPNLQRIKNMSSPNKKQDSNLNSNEFQIFSTNFSQKSQLIQKRKQFNQKSKQQIQISEKNGHNYTEHGIISKLMKNIRSSFSIDATNEKIINSSILIDKKNQLSGNPSGNMSSFYNVLCRPKTGKKVKKKKENWFEKFFSANKENQKTRGTILDDAESSIQYIDKSTPGPAHYCPSKQNLSLKKNTFGSEQRFKCSRPITSLVNYLETQQKISSISTNQNQVAFGTLKKHHRSPVQKIEYCDWYRSHCCENFPSMKSESDKKAKHLDPKYSSKLKRFREPVSEYSGPDYYQKLSSLEKSGRVQSHFSSEIKKSKKDNALDARDYLAQDQQTISKENKNTAEKKVTKIHPSKNFKFKFIKSEDENEEQNRKKLKEDIPDLKRKNTNLLKSGVKRYNPPFYHGKKTEQKAPSPTTYNTNKKWGISTFNVRFQPIAIT